MDDDAELVARLQAGDEEAFVTLVDRFHAPMLRLAANYVPNRAVAEEVVQDTWLGVVRGIERFEGRSSLKTWLFRILVNRARTTGVRERREQPVDPSYEPAVSPERFAASGAWARPPAPWADEADERIAARQTVRHLAKHLSELPDGQRHVVLMRDLEGLSASEVCDVLGISEGNQRVLLHRGRSRIRTMLEHELGERLKVLLRRRDVVCREAVELVTDYLEGGLTWRDRARFERHLTECPHCREYLDQMRATIAVLGRVEPDSLAPEVRDELVALYHRWRA